MDLELEGKIALVTGSSRGIGFAIARALYREGCTVVLNSRNQHDLDDIFNQFGLTGVAGDVSQSNCAEMVIGEVFSRHGTLDILVSNVGDGASLAPGREGWSEWERMLNANLLAAVNAVSAARDALIRSKGVVLCISSICGLAALDAPLAYSAAKAALNSYVRGMSRVFADNGVRMNALAPGNVCFEGSSWDKRFKRDPEGVKAMLNREVSLKRFGTTEEIADIAVFLCSKRSSFMNGEILVADGGQLRG